MGVIAAVAEFERNLLVERTQLVGACKAEGKTLGRPARLFANQARILHAAYKLAKPSRLLRASSRLIERLFSVRRKRP